MSEREARILAKLNARKNKKTTNISKNELQINGRNPAKCENNNTAEIPKCQDKILNLPEVTPEQTQMTNGKVKKKKRKITSESENAMKCDSVPDDIAESKMKLIGEAVSELAINEKEVDTGKPKKKKKKQKVLSGENDTDIPECQGQSPKKKKKKVATEPTTNEIHPSNNVEEGDPMENNEPQKEEEPAGTGFTVLEEFKADKNQKVFRVLPTWLAKPSVISCDLIKNKMPIKELNGLDKFILDALRRNKIAHFFPGTFYGQVF